jgi:hypothetical protein
LPADDPSCSVTRSRSSMVLMRFPLWANATDVSPSPPRVGWAFSQVDPPVVEYRVCPTAMCPRSDASADSSKTWLTSPMSL